jgi:hypothetical protein
VLRFNSFEGLEYIINAETVAGDNPVKKGEMRRREIGLCPRITVRGGDKGQSPGTWVEWLGGPYVHRGNNSPGHGERGERENCVINADASQLPQELMTQV